MRMVRKSLREISKTARERARGLIGMKMVRYGQRKSTKTASVSAWNALNNNEKTTHTSILITDFI